MLNIQPTTVKKVALLPLLLYSMICFSQAALLPGTNLKNENGAIDFIKSENGHLYFRVGLSGIPTNGCQIRITDQSGEIIYENRIYGNAYSKVFKFADYNMSKISFDISGKKYQLNRSFDLTYRVETKLEVTKL